MRTRLFFLVCLLIGVLGAVVRPASAEPKPAPPFFVVVHPSNPNHALERRFVANAFLKKSTRWPGGDVIRPVDQRPDSRTRARFSEDVLTRSVAAVKSYWQQIIFSGRDVPPPELAGDEEVLKYVAQNPSAIGYVSGATPLAGVKPIQIE